MGRETLHTQLLSFYETRSLSQTAEHRPIKCVSWVCCYAELVKFTETSRRLLP